MNRLVLAFAGTLLFIPLPALAQGTPSDAPMVAAQAQKGPDKAADQQKNTPAPAKESGKDAPMKKRRKAGGCG